MFRSRARVRAVLRRGHSSCRIALCSTVGALPLAVVTAQENGPPSTRQQALEQALRDSTPPAAATTLPSPVAPPPDGGAFRLVDVSLDVVAAAGTSTARDDELGMLQGGGHDPRQRGFTLQQAELSLAGAVDPYFDLESHIVTFLEPGTGDTRVELEEAYVTTRALPADLQGKVGVFLTEFGRLNPTHPHAWDWQDQPVIHSRVFGGDGMRAPGARLAWLLPTPSFTELTLTVQNASGEQMRSFLANAEVYAEAPPGGRAFAAGPVRSLRDLVWSARLSTGFDLSTHASVAVGCSGAVGPNATGEGASTVIDGVDVVYKWRGSGERGYPFFTLQGELLARDFATAAQVDASGATPVVVPPATLRDRGGHLQAVWGFCTGFDLGLRAEWAGGSGNSYDRATQVFGRDGDPLRADRFRLAPLLAWHPSEFSRLRLQYDYDETDALARPVHSVWLGFELLIGKHPPHRY